jgi:integrase
MRRDYLLQRPGSQNWRLRLQLDGKAVERSLGTPDRALADVRAAPLIAEHKLKLLERRPTLTSVWVPELAPGLHVVNGEQIFATNRELNYLDASGAVTRTAPNGSMATQFSGFTGKQLTVQNMTRDLREAFEPRPTVATKNDDDALFETYLKERNVTGFKEGEARHMWALFRELCPGVKLKDATRDDGRKLVAHLETLGNKSATVRKKMMWLAACVNFGIDEGRFRFNAFVHIVPKKKDATKRYPFSDDEMKLIVENLDKLSAADRLLVRIIATTGMRLDEAYQITSEKKERGVRFTVIGTKTEQSERRIPFPAKLLPHLPDKIEGPLFADKAQLASGRLRKFLRRVCGITDKGKVAAHSFRHRAQDRLRVAGCRKDIREELLGHTRKTVGEGYGEGHPVPVLKRWIDKIGF